jgi:beta-phosphoglucomutase-like phosphatase (HAD superfamily)
MNGKLSIETLDDALISALEEAYFSEDAQISLISPQLPAYFDKLRMSGMQVALNTGYPAKIQERILSELGMKDMVDSYTCAYNVSAGRPMPYMVFELMEKCGIANVKQVAKAGDTVADIGEGKNAGCGLNIGVTSGADSAEALSGADIIVPDITHVPLEFYSIGGANIKAVLDFQKSQDFLLHNIVSGTSTKAAEKPAAKSAKKPATKKKVAVKTSGVHGPTDGQQIKINIA